MAQHTINNRTANRTHAFKGKTQIFAIKQLQLALCAYSKTDLHISIHHTVMW